MKRILPILGAMLVCIVGVIASLQAAPAVPKSYQATNVNSLRPLGSVRPTPNGPGFEFSAKGPAPVQPSSSGSHYVARLSDQGDCEWGLTTYGPARGEILLETHPTEPIALALMEGLVDEEFWTVFGAFDGRTGTRRWERGIRVVQNKINEFVVLPHPFVSVKFLPSGAVTVVVDDHRSSVRAGVFGASGDALWQKEFVSPTLAETTSKSWNAVVLEDPTSGYWVLLRGNEENNGMPTQVLHLVRLSSDGTVLWTRKLAGWSQTSWFTAKFPTFSPSGGLLLKEVDVRASPGVPQSIFSAIAYCDAQGRILWARHFPDVALPTSDVGWTSSGTHLFVGMTKLVSTTPIRVENWLVKIDARSGAVVSSVKVGTPTTIGPLEISGVSDTRVYFSARESAPSQAGFVGYADLELNNPVWRKFSHYPLARTPRLTFDPRHKRVYYAPAHPERGWSDLIPLDLNLGTGDALVLPGSSPAPCEFFSAAAIPLADFTLSTSVLPVEQQDSAVEIREGKIDLVPSTRLKMQPFTLQVQDLCLRATSAIKPPAIEIRLKPSGDLKLLLETELGITYDVLYTPSLAKAFEIVATLAGNGSTTEHIITAPRVGEGYYCSRARLGQ